MKKRFTEEQIIKILHEAERGITIDEIIRKYNIGRTTFYGWRKRFQGMSIPEAKRLRSLEKENTSLKQLLAESTLDNKILKDVLSKKW